MLFRSNKILSFKVDGKAQSDPFIPATISGTHEIDIQLNNRPFHEAGIHITENKFSLPEPQVMRNGTLLEWKPVDGAVSYQVFKNGKLVAEIESTRYETNSNATAEYQIAAKDKNSVSSFASEPILITDEKNVQVIEIEKLKAKLNQFSIQLAASTAHLIVKSNSPIITPSEKIISSQNVINKIGRAHV